MNDVAHDGKASGEIVVRAPWLTQGYFENPTASEDLWRGGYMRTNDIANITEHGYLQITDRIKDVIKSGGEWISSLQLEDIIMKAPGVKEVAVIGVKDEKWAERPALNPLASRAIRSRNIREANASDRGRRSPDPPRTPSAPRRRNPGCAGRPSD